MGQDERGGALRSPWGGRALTSDGGHSLVPRRSRAVPGSLGKTGDKPVTQPVTLLTAGSVYAEATARNTSELSFQEVPHFQILFVNLVKPGIRQSYIYSVCV